MDPEDGGAPAAWERQGATGRAGSTSTRERSRPVGRVATIASQLPWLRDAPPERRREWARVLVEARRRAHDRKQRIRAHPELADRLAGALGYRRFDQWSGYLPEEGGPVRAELIDIMRAVVDRERAAA